jgi:predicted DNA-binding transcriptional regulator AlpA
MIKPNEQPVAPLGMSIAEFCARAGFSDRQFFRLDARGEAPKTVRIGRRRLILEETARAWLKEREA